MNILRKLFVMMFAQVTRAILVLASNIETIINSLCMILYYATYECDAIVTTQARVILLKSNRDK